MSGFNCSKCEDTGAIGVPQEMELLGFKRKVIVEEYCTCKKGIERQINDQSKPNIELSAEEKRQKQFDSNIENGFGKIYIGAKLTDFPENSKTEELKKYIYDSTWLYLHGESRSGKTHLAAAIYREIGGVIVKSVELDMIMSYFSVEGRKEKIENIAKANILFIDDLGVGKITHERHSMYYYIIDRRISNNLKTIFTSNYKTTALWEGSVDVDPIRLVTRIQEAGKGFKLENRKIVDEKKEG